MPWVTWEVWSRWNELRGSQSTVFPPSHPAIILPGLITSVSQGHTYNPMNLLTYSGLEQEGAALGKSVPSWAPLSERKEETLLGEPQGLLLSCLWALLPQKVSTWHRAGENDCAVPGATNSTRHWNARPKGVWDGTLLLGPFFKNFSKWA